MNWFDEAFVRPLVEYGFMRDGLAVAAIVGMSSAILSCLLVVRRQSLLGDAISHAVLLGVALGWLAGGRVGVFWGALVIGVASGVAITFIERNSRIALDAAMGIVFTTAFAAGLAIMSAVRPAGIDLFHVLFGNVLGVTPADVWLTAASGGLVVTVVALLFRDFHLWSFDAEQARALGVPVRVLHYLFTALLSAAIVAALQAVGLVLVIAMLIIPGATASLLTERLAAMMRVAVVLGLVAGVGGLYGSYHVDVASGPAMVLTGSALFALAFVLAPRRGLLVRALRRRAAVRRAAAEDALKALYKAEREGAAVPPAQEPGAQPAVAVRTLRWLHRRGLVAGDPARVTAEGEREAVRLVRAHRVLEAYLHDAEGHTLDELHAEADRLEHEVPEAVIEDIAATFGQPTTDPHGHPIPPRGGALRDIAGHRLTDAEPGRRGRVQMVTDDRDDLLREMVALGIVPGTELVLLHSTPRGVRARIGGTEVDLPEEIAARVPVTPVPAPAPRPQPDRPPSDQPGTSRRR